MPSIQLPVGSISEGRMKTSSGRWAGHHIELHLRKSACQGTAIRSVMLPARNVSVSLLSRNGSRVNRHSSLYR